MKNRFAKPMIEVLRKDVVDMITRSGNDVTFEWEEVTGGTWNEVYEVMEGGTKVIVTHTERCVGKVVWYKEDLISYEYGKLNLGDCVLRFPHDSNIFDVLRGRTNVVFTYQNQRFEFNSPFDIGDMIDNQLYSKIIRGVKSTV